ncbi:MAG: hypothetical protein HYU77_10050 [Betaproteobacteria bacterium]|nr:hypothetical protein [Betaproteobacteria bacterium]
MDREAVRQAVRLDPGWVAALKRNWVSLMELAVFGDLKAVRLGVMGRLRKRVLDLGEKLASLAAERDWIPHPREQLKNALGAAFALKESLAQLEQVVAEADKGSDSDALRILVGEIGNLLASRLPELENRWAELLDAQYRDEEDAR